jgi:hypothetical protein
VSDDRDAFYESLQEAAARRGPVESDPAAEQARDDAIAAARPRTHGHLRRLLEIDADDAWAALLGEEITEGLGSFGPVIEILARARAEYETFARTSDAFEAAVASQFAEAITASGVGYTEVVGIADAMLGGDWFKPANVEAMAARMEEVTALAIAAIRAEDRGTARRQELGSQLHFAAVQLLLG